MVALSTERMLAQEADAVSRGTTWLTYAVASEPLGQQAQIQRVRMNADEREGEDT